MVESHEIPEWTMNQELLDILSSYYSDDGYERVGFIMQDDNIIEVNNVSGDPAHTFVVRGEDLLQHVINSNAVASWHTHPGRSANLTSEDYQAFRNYPEMKHIIIGNDGIRIYGVDNDRVINA